MSRYIFLSISLVTLYAFCGKQAIGQEEQIEIPDAEHCVSLSRIERTEVLDDSNILFHMHSGLIYRNELAQKCPGLSLEDTFMYRTSVGQLCDLDVVTVLNSIGFGFTSGPSCGLGKFYPVTEQDVARLKRKLSGS